MGHEDGRCKLVFARRGNPAAESTLAATAPPLLQATLQAMTAHEIGHCQRHRSGAFDRLPNGLADQPDGIGTSQPAAELQPFAREMRVSAAKRPTPTSSAWPGRMPTTPTSLRRC